jgi:SAM-dependent methyltransferase
VAVATEIRTSTGAKFTVPVPAGPLEIVLRDGYQSGLWRYQVQAPAELTVDYLDPWLCSIEGQTPIERDWVEGCIPAPRLRLSVNGVILELVSSNERVLQRHYGRPAHQEVAYAPRPDRFLGAYHMARIRQCRRLLRGVTGRVCDVGCGYSLVTMAGPWPFDLHACDRDPHAVEHLRRQGVEAVVAPAEEPPFPAATFDAVYAGEIIEHLTQPEAALACWVRLLRPGGRLIVTTPNRRHLLTRVRGFELVENPEHLFEWDVGEFYGAAQRAGAVVTHIEGLVLPLPVWIPGRGWRDLGAGALRRVPIPTRMAVAIVEMGRPLPKLATDIALVAQRRGDT